MARPTTPLDALVSEIYQAGAGLRQWTAPLRTLARLTRSRHALLQACTLRTSPMQLVYLLDDGELDHDRIADYGDFMREHGDPRAEFAARRFAAGDLRGFCDFDFLDERAMDRLPYYTEVLAPLGLRYASVQLLPRRGDMGIGLTLQRTPRQGPAHPEAVALQQRAAAHFDQALRIHDTLFPGCTPGNPAIAGASSAGVSVLGLGGELLVLDPSLERYLLDSGLCRLRHNFLTGATMSLQRDIDRALFGASRGCVQTLHLPQPGLELRFLPMVPDDGLFLPTPRVLVCVQPKRTEPSALDALLRERYGVTPKEVEVARLLAQGVAPKEIASRRGVSVHTVRTQMKSVFQKLDVRSQRELVVTLGKLSKTE